MLIARRPLVLLLAFPYLTLLSLTPRAGASYLPFYLPVAIPDPHILPAGLPSILRTAAAAAKTTATSPSTRFRLRLCLYHLKTLAHPPFDLSHTSP